MKCNNRDLISAVSQQTN